MTVYDVCVTMYMYMYTSILHKWVRLQQVHVQYMYNQSRSSVNTIKLTTSYNPYISTATVFLVMYMYMYMYMYIYIVFTCKCMCGVILKLTV